MIKCEIILINNDKKYVDVEDRAAITYPHDNWTSIQTENETLLYPNAEVKRIRLFESKFESVER